MKIFHISAGKLKSIKVNNGDIKLLSTGKFDGFTSKDLIANQINKGEVITLPSGGSANIKYYNGEFIDSGNILASTYDKRFYNTKYIYYYLLSINDIISNCYRGSGVKHPDMTQVLDLKIPIPPLPVQEEIVRILDKFTNLTAELEAELEARKKQYEFYRDRLLTFDNTEKNALNKQRIEYRTLEELFILKNGYTPSKANKDFWTNGTIPWFRMEDIRANGNVLNDSIQHITKNAVKNSFLFPADTIILATSATIGEHALIKVKFLANQRFTALMLKDDYKSVLDIKYFYYLMFKIDNWCKENTNISNFPSVNMEKLKSLVIPIPSLHTQQKIVSILDRFNALCADLTSGLPAEIEARKKQYEYYRDKLLTFNKL
ncbi:MAG: restriction endonuclease subunit S [Bdellovibrionota bacterium]|nr:restriction endonuclease subunit S [Bdellovibrionota bacterium]